MYVCREGEGSWQAATSTQRPAAHTHPKPLIPTGIQALIHTHTHTYTYIHTYAYMQKPMYIHNYMRVSKNHAYLFTYILIDTYTLTYIHT